MTNDVVIVGGGPAGLTAGIYACRAGMDTLLVEKVAPGGMIATADLVENYPGFPEGIAGYELVERMRKQAENSGLTIESDEITGLKGKGKLKVLLSGSSEYEAYSVIVASGRTQVLLGIPGENEFRGKGVSFCATCDGPFFRDKDVAVIGGGNAAAHEAIFLSKLAARVYLVHRRDRLRAEKALQKQIFSNDKIEFVGDSVAESIEGKKTVETLNVKNLGSGQSASLGVSAVFIAVGAMPNTGFLKDQVDLDEAGYVITGNDMETSHEGIYACGDVRKKNLWQVVNACGEGAVAASSAARHVDELKGTAYGEDFSVQGSSL